MLLRSSLLEIFRMILPTRAKVVMKIVLVALGQMQTIVSLAQKDRFS